MRGTSACTAPGCERRHHARGLCADHYQRALRASLSDAERAVYRQTVRVKQARWRAANPERARSYRVRRCPECSREIKRALLASHVARWHGPDATARCCGCGAFTPHPLRLCAPCLTARYGTPCGRHRARRDDAVVNQAARWGYRRDGPDGPRPGGDPPRAVLARLARDARALSGRRRTT